MMDWKSKSKGLTAFITHPDCMLHNVGDIHPENPQRLVSVRDQLMASQLFDSLNEVEAPNVTPEQLRRVHTAKYLDYLEMSEPETGTFRVDPDTALMKHTLTSARRAAGGVIKAVDMVCRGEAPNAFCAIRPPGHHAESEKAMGFCYYNNVAVGIRHALAEHGLARAAVIDFDVHHGNGTEEIFQDEPNVLMCSIFQHPFFPYSGDVPMGANMVNIPMKAGSGSVEFRDAVIDGWMPRLREFKPEIIFISAGFDAHREDDMGMMGLLEKDYEWVTRQLQKFANQYCEGRLVSVLEGGYDLSALGRSVAAHVRALTDI